MNDAVRELTHLLPQPATAAPPKDWAAVARQLGTDLPTDYKDFIATHGGGYVDNYLWILEPGCANDNYDLVDNDEERTEAFEYLWDGDEGKPRGMEEEGARLIPWASTDNGEFLYWLTRPGQDPDTWTVMVNEARGSDWEHFDTGFAPFLLAVLNATLHSGILSDRFPTTPHGFRPAGDFV